TPDYYTVTLLSGNRAFQDTNNNALDGNHSGVPGTNYVTSFIAARPSNAVTFAIPDFARGPDGNGFDVINLVVNAPLPLSGGIPITVNVPASVTITSATITLQYNDTIFSGSSVQHIPIAAIHSTSGAVVSSTADASGNATTVLTFNT